MQRFIGLTLMFLMLVLAGVGERACAQFVSDSNWAADVRTATLTKNGVDQEPPVLSLGSDDRLLLRFDVLGAEVENFRYRISHCNRLWQVDDMQPYEYINGFEEGAIDNYNSSFTTLTDYVNYYQYIPSAYSQLLLSGNYVVAVTLQDRPDSVVLTRRFCVVEGSVKTEAWVDVPYDAGGVTQRREVDVRLSPNADYHGHQLPPMLNPQYLSVVVQQNGRTDNMRQLQFGGYDNGALAYRNHAENVFDCGNTFRYFDISNIRTPMYNVAKIAEIGGEWYALLRPLEDRSGKPFLAETQLTGGMKVNVWDRQNKQVEADYVWVTWMLPMPYPYMNGSVHVVGDLTQWKLDDASRMDYNPEMKAYTLRMQLKQGYYSYQLLFKPVGENVGQTDVLEGDYYQTANHYQVMVYYRAPNDRYDRLVGYVRL